MFIEIEKRLRIDLNSNIELKHQELENMREEWITLYKPVYEESKKYLFNLKNKLERIRVEYPNSDIMNNIELKFSEAIKAHISATLFIIGG